MESNKLMALNNHLFEQLERLNDDSLTAEQFELELERSKAISLISNRIIDNAKLSLDAEKFKHESLGRQAKMPEMIEND